MRRCCRCLMVVVPYAIAGDWVHTDSAEFYSDGVYHEDIKARGGSGFWVIEAETYEAKE